VAKAASEFGNGMILSSVSHPGLDATAEVSGDGFKIFSFMSAVGAPASSSMAGSAAAPTSSRQ
jgi:hypothetical protein